MSGIADSIMSLANNGISGLMLGEVIKVDKNESTCDVELLTGGEILGVRLRPVIDSDKLGIIVYPEIGAFAAVALFNNSDSESCLINTSSFESLFIAIKDTFECSVNSDGQVLVKSGKIELGDQGGEPLVKGDALNARIKELISELRTVNQSLIQFASAQGTAAAASGVLAPLSAGYSTLAGSLSPVLGKLSALEGKLSSHLSQITSTK